MPGFRSIIGQKQPARILATLLRRGTLPHALLFCGIDSAGKKTAAMTVAMSCNCLSLPQSPARGNAPVSVDGDDFFEDVNPCGACRSCRKIRSDNHPDIIGVSPSGPIIRVAQIRMLAESLAMKPYEARQRFVIIADAQAMNPEAGNALLKLLEEPPDRTIFILLAGQASDLLATIASRCRPIHFYPLPAKELQALLVEQEQLPPPDAGVVAALAGGDYTKALLFSRPFKQTDWAHWRAWLLDGSGLRQPQRLAKRAIALHLAFAEQLAAHKDVLPEALEVLKTWLRDLVIYKFDPEKIIHRDLTETVREASQSHSVSELIAKIEILQAAQKSIRANANPRLTLEAMMVKLAG